MPNCEEHCEHTLKRYGVEGRDIHTWIDEPSKLYGASHREVRHDTEAREMVKKIFGEKYGENLAENIFLDHMLLDLETKNKEDALAYEVILEKERLKIKRKQLRERAKLQLDRYEKLSPKQLLKWWKYWIAFSITGSRTNFKNFNKRMKSLKNNVDFQIMTEMLKKYNMLPQVIPPKKKGETVTFK